MPEPLRLLRQAATAPEAQIIESRLREAGIEAIAQRSIGGPEWGLSGAQTVYVQDADLARAQEVLAADEQPIDDDELARLSEEAGREGGAAADE